MRTIHVAVSVEDKFAAIFVPLPFGNHLHVYALLDRTSDEQATQRALAEWRVT